MGRAVGRWHTGPGGGGVRGVDRRESNVLNNESAGKYGGGKEIVGQERSGGTDIKGLRTPLGKDTNGYETVGDWTSNTNNPTTGKMDVCRWYGTSNVEHRGSTVSSESPISRE